MAVSVARSGFKVAPPLPRSEPLDRDAKLAGRALKDGDVRTACQQACPAGAIEFGDIRDESSRVAKSKADARNYALLEELNTKPRTTYLTKVRNPNPELEGMA